MDVLQPKGEVTNCGQVIHQVRHPVNVPDPPGHLLLRLEDQLPGGGDIGFINRWPPASPTSADLLVNATDRRPTHDGDPFRVEGA